MKAKKKLQNKSITFNLFLKQFKNRTLLYKTKLTVKSGSNGGCVVLTGNISNEPGVVTGCP